MGGSAGVAILLMLSASICLDSVASADPVQQTGCEHNGRRYLPGDKWTATGTRACAEFSCEQDSDARLAVTITRCDYFYAGPKCRYVPGNASAPYPDCCPHLRCS